MKRPVTPASRPPPRAAPALPPPLLGLFRELLAHGVPLGVRDYLDGLRALDAGYGGTGRPDRHELEALATALWVRTDDERALLKRWFARLPPPPTALVIAAQGAVDGAERVVATAGAAPPTGPRDPADGRDASGATPGGSGAPLEGPSAEAPSASARIALGSTRDSGGLALPTVTARDLVLGADYLRHPLPVIPLRQLAVLWRRWRRGQRSGPKIELDLAGTLRARSEQGFIGTPVMRARRRNAARLLVLADASTSMLPWQGFVALVAESLAQGRLGRATVRWFDNVPRQRLYLDAAMQESESREECLARHEGAAVLVISDAGSARGRLDRRRAALSSEFVAAVAALRARLVWINPMPAPRWAGSTAALIGADARLTMLPLAASEMLRAVDLLRGSK